ncbi:MAG: prepilin-type N-terminal cleavage/methylation domain-containing protein [Verrucomicrobiota bacterium]
MGSLLKGGVMRQNNRGFSYIELLVSATLCLIFYLLVLGPSSNIGQRKSKAACARNLQQSSLALTLYAQEHDGAYPAVPGATSSEEPLSLLVPLYTTDTSLFICPGSRDSSLPSAQPFAHAKISYAYYMGLKKEAGAEVPLLSDAQVHTGAKAAGTPLFSASGSAPGHNHRKYGGNILFADGHVETTSGMTPRELPLLPGVTLLNPKP